MVMQNASETQTADIFRLLVSAVKDYAIFMLDTEGRVITWNEGAQRIKGYSADEIIGKHFSVFYEDDLKHSGHCERELQAARTNGSYEEVGWRVRNDGSRFWANVVITALYDNGVLVGYAKVTRDLSDQKRLDTERERVARENELFRLLVANVIDYAIFALDPDGHILTWNDGAQRLKGYSVEEIIGKHFSIFYTKQARESMHPQKELKIAGRTGRYEEEGWRVRKDGTMFWANVVITALHKDGTLIGFAKVTRDLTERRLAEQQAHFRLIAESIPQALWTADAAGGCDYFNQRWYQLTALTPQQSMNGGWIAAVDSGYREATWQYWQEHLNTGEPVEIEVPCQTPFGIRWMLVRATVLQDENRKISKWIGTITDVHERRAYREELEHLVTERTAELRHAHDEAVSANEAKSRFLSTVSHEVRTPIAGVIGLIELLVVSSQDEDSRLLAKTALDSSKRLLQILNDLLEASKLQSGKVQLELRPFPVRPIIGDVVQLVRAEANKKNLLVTSRVAEDVPQLICGDELRLRQILLNLAFNAVKFTLHGSVHLEVNVIKALPTRTRLRFSVQDTGIGISPEQKTKLFEPFMQAESSTSRVFGGTGLGLSICKTLVELMKGEIEVDSEIGKGATFSAIIEFDNEVCPSR